MSVIHFKATLLELDASEKFGSGVVIALPKSASAKLPSRGMTMVEGTINDLPFQVAVEPDGKGGHWFRISKAIRKGVQVDAGDTVLLAIEPLKEWPEPKVPSDLNKALIANSKALAVWLDITPQARWDWIRWISAAKQLKTRERRIEVACSKLKSGKRRPCCFNRTECTLTDA